MELVLALGFPFFVRPSFFHAFPVLITFHLINDLNTTVHTSLRFETEAVGVSGGWGVDGGQGEIFFIKLKCDKWIGLFFNKEKPDVWIEPSKSKIVQVKATEIINSDKYVLCLMCHKKKHFCRKYP